METGTHRLEEANAVLVPPVEGESEMNLIATDAIHESAVHAVASRVAPDALRVGEAAAVVTLIVYGWTAAEPGTLWWAFPSVTAALLAARAMKNAVRWAIVKGPPRGAIDIAKARASGAVLIEQTTVG